MRVVAVFLFTTFLCGSCSRHDNNTGANSASPTPPPNLRADAERVQDAINRTAASRAQATPTETPTVTVTPQP